MEYSLKKDITTDFGKSYSGPAQTCVYRFQTGPEQISFVDNWVKDRYIKDSINAVQKNGGQAIRLRLYRDAAPTWVTNWRAEITATVPAGMAQGARMSGFWAAVLILSVVSIVAYLLIKPVIESVTDLVWGPGESGASLFGIPWVGWAVLAGVTIYAFSRRKRKSKARKSK